MLFEELENGAFHGLLDTSNIWWSTSGISGATHDARGDFVIDDDDDAPHLPPARLPADPQKTTIAQFLALARQLEEVEVVEHSRFFSLEVAGRTFGYLWEPTRTVGLKQTLAEQAALVGERPEVFEVQFTAGAFGWVVVHLEGIDRQELAELTFEAWRLSAPAALLDERGDRLPE